MKKYNNYYYSIRHVGFIERNNISPIKLYSYAVYTFLQKKRTQTVISGEEFDSKEVAEYEAKKYIDKIPKYNTKSILKKRKIYMEAITSIMAKEYWYAKFKNKNQLK